MRCFVGTHLGASALSCLSDVGVRIFPYIRTHPLGFAACHRLYAGGKKVRPYITLYNRYSGTLATFAVMFVVFVLGW